MAGRRNSVFQDLVAGRKESVGGRRKSVVEMFVDGNDAALYKASQAEAARRQKAEAEGRGARRKSVSERFVGEVNEAMKADGVGMAKRQKPVGQMLGFGDEFEPTNHDKRLKPLSNPKPMQNVLDFEKVDQINAQLEAGREPGYSNFRSRFYLGPEKVDPIHNITNPLEWHDHDGRYWMGGRNEPGDKSAELNTNQKVRGKWARDMRKRKKRIQRITRDEKEEEQLLYGEERRNEMKKIKFFVDNCRSTRSMDSALRSVRDCDMHSSLDRLNARDELRETRNWKTRLARLIPNTKKAKKKKKQTPKDWNIEVKKLPTGKRTAGICTGHTDGWPDHLATI